MFTHGPLLPGGADIQSIPPVSGTIGATLPGLSAEFTGEVDAPAAVTSKSGVERLRAYREQARLLRKEEEARRPAQVLRPEPIVRVLKPAVVKEEPATAIEDDLPVKRRLDRALMDADLMEFVSDYMDVV
jgi:hypothetical protein